MIPETPDYDPHRICLLNDPWMITVHNLADLLIAAAYFTIPVVLLYFVIKRRDFPFGHIVLWFGGFILACGSTHIGNAMEMWWGLYGATTVIKVITALVSWITAILLLPLLPTILRLPGMDRMQRVRAWMQRPVEETMPEMLGEIDQITKVLTAFLTDRTRTHRGTDG